MAASKGHAPRKTLHIASAIRWWAFCLLILLIVAFFAGLLPAKPVAVATGSMEPAISVGDAVIVVPANPASLQEGDIIQYRADGYTVIHRIVETTELHGEPAFITQGDYNNAADAKPVLYTDVTGRVIFTIPKLGYITLWLHGQLS